jgi:hypothetical protein
LLSGVQQESVNTLAGGSSNNASTIIINNNNSSSFAFPTGLDFETTYNLTINNDNNATIGYSCYISDSSSNQNPITNTQNGMFTTTTTTTAAVAQHNVVKMLADTISNSKKVRKRCCYD